MNGFEHVLFQSVRGFVDYKQHLLPASNAMGATSRPPTAN
jgi:hypothetical protein